MNVILWATLTANGNYARSDATHPPFPAALADFGALIRQTGCFVVGRTTFEGFRASGAQLDPSIRVVVVTNNELAIPGVAVANSPQEALALLEKEGFESVALAGGAQLHNSFLQQDLVDEIIFNVAPALEDEGYKILLAQGAYTRLSLIDSKHIGEDVIQLHYKLT